METARVGKIGLKHQPTVKIVLPTRVSFICLTVRVISLKNGLTVWAWVWSAGWGCHVDEDKKQLCGGVVKAVMSVCEQRWTMKTVRGGGWSAWMRWPHWRSSSLTWRNSKLSDMFHTESSSEIWDSHSEVFFWFTGIFPVTWTVDLGPF